MTLQSILQVLVSGLQVGCIYALMALSFYVIQSATGILNFAQGEWAMISAVLGVVFLQFLLEELGDQVFKDLLADIAFKLFANQTGGRLAGPETRQPGSLPE